MKARTILLTLLCAVGITTVKANEKIYVNRDVTTHIVMPERIKLVDISTPKIAGNQCTDNIVRIKPYHEGDSIQSGRASGHHHAHRRTPHRAIRCPLY